MSSAITLVGSGVVMGIVHVLTGPDHLSALATLSSNVGNLDSFWYGVRWGVGHSMGLIAVGSVLILWDYQKEGHDGRDDDDTIDMPESVQSFFESIVGIFLLLLGIHGLVSAVNLRREYSLDVLEERGAVDANTMQSNRHLLGGPTPAGNESNQNEVRPIPPSRLDSMRSVELGILGSFDSTSRLSESSHSSSRVRPSVVVTPDEDPYMDNVTYPTTTDQDIHNHPHDHGHYFGDHLCCSRSMLCFFEIFCFLPTCRASGRSLCLTCTEYEISRKVLSVGIGIIHGVAGPGGVLGVIPAVQLHDWKLAFVYLGTFCLTSTLVMGTFAATYGLLSSKVSNGVANFEFRMNVFSSCLSIAVGILWLVLLSLGKLHEFFP